MKKDLVELVFVVDRSGSMAGLESDTIGGINATLRKHREAEGETYVSIVLFDNETEVLRDRVEIEKVSELTEKDYWVRGCTALLDAVGGSIRHVSRVHGYLPEEWRPEQTIFVITTDGMENASREYSYDKVKQMIEGKRKEGWEFLFLGANIDAAAEACRIGIEADRAATYVPDHIGNQVMYDAVCSETMAMRPNCAANTPKRSRSAWKRMIDHDNNARGKRF